MSRRPTHGAIEYDDQDEWLTETDAEGASRIVARAVPQWFGRLVVATLSDYADLREAVRYVVQWADNAAEWSVPPPLNEELRALRDFLTASNE